MAKLRTQSDGRCRAYYKGKRFSGKTSEEARAKRDAYKYEVEHGIEKPEMITVIDLAEQWMPIAYPAVDSRTYNQYATVMEKMTDLIGNKLVAAVTPSDIKKVWIQFNGLSQSYINKAKFLYKAFFRYAIDNGYCRTNPVMAESAKPHKGTKGTHRCLTEEEVHLIETVPHRVQAAAIFMLKAGLRRGEVLALRKRDIHDGRIHVKESVKFINNRPVVGGTKNESSNREVPLFASISSIMDLVSDYVLPDANGSICSEMAFKRAWDSYLHTLSQAAGHPVSFRPHDLRHTFITTARNRNVDIHTVMDWCGHSSERMILQIYDHTSAERERSAIALMDG